MESVSRCTALHVIAVSMVDICTLINSEVKRDESNKSLKLTYCTVPFCRLGLAGRVSLWRCSRHIPAAGPWMPPGLEVPKGQGGELKYIPEQQKQLSQPKIHTRSHAQRFSCVLTWIQQSWWTCADSDLDSLRKSMERRILKILCKNNLSLHERCLGGKIGDLAHICLGCRGVYIQLKHKAALTAPVSHLHNLCGTELASKKFQFSLRLSKSERLSWWSPFWEGTWRNRV